MQTEDKQFPISSLSLSYRTHPGGAWATWMSPRRQRSIVWSGRYRPISLYLGCTEVGWQLRNSRITRLHRNCAAKLPRRGGGDTDDKHIPENSLRMQCFPRNSKKKISTLFCFDVFVYFRVYTSVMVTKLRVGLQWNPSRKARNVSGKLGNLVHFQSPFFTYHVYFTPHDRPPLLKDHHLGWPL